LRSAPFSYLEVHRSFQAHERFQLVNPALAWRNANTESFFAAVEPTVRTAPSAVVEPEGPRLGATQPPPGWRPRHTSTHGIALTAETRSRMPHHLRDVAAEVVTKRVVALSVHTHETVSLPPRQLDERGQGRPAKLGMPLVFGMRLTRSFRVRHRSGAIRPYDVLVFEDDDSPRDRLDGVPDPVADTIHVE
jgi:hypothetical protein